MICRKELKFLKENYIEIMENIKKATLYLKTKDSLYLESPDLNYLFSVHKKNVKNAPFTFSIKYRDEYLFISDTFSSAFGVEKIKKDFFKVLNENTVFQNWK